MATIPPRLPYWSGLDAIVQPLFEPPQWSPQRHCHPWRLAVYALVAAVGMAISVYVKLCWQDRRCDLSMTDFMRSCLSVALLAFAGGVARLLYSYKQDMGWAAAARIVVTSFYVGIVVGLVVWEPLQGRPTLLLALIAATSWLGVDLARSLFEMIVKRLLGGQGEGNGNGAAVH